MRNGTPYNPGDVITVWEPGMVCNPFTILNIPRICDSSFTYGGPLFSHFIFIADDTNNSMDVVVHETGHMFMVNVNNGNGWWLFDPPCWGHTMSSSIDVNCAWSEGWADFLPLAVNGDQCYNFGKNPCQDNFVDLEHLDRSVPPSQ